MKKLAWLVFFVLIPGSVFTAFTSASGFIKIFPPERVRLSVITSCSESVLSTLTLSSGLTCILVRLAATFLLLKVIFLM